MKEVTIKNEMATAVISSMAAEVHSFMSNEMKVEMIWQRDPKYWYNCNPILFPFKGKINDDDSYTFNGKTYKIGKHGFARNSEFKFVKIWEDGCTLELQDNDVIYSTMYPFHFKLSVTYQLENKTLNMIYEVENLDDKDLPFDINFHPAFNFPFTSERCENDYNLIFDKPQVFKTKSDDYGKGRILHLSNILKKDKQSCFFHNHQIKSNYVDYVDCDFGIRIGLEGSTVLGIWRRSEDAPFISIEPHCYEIDLPKKNFFSSNSVSSMLKPNEKYCLSYYWRLL